MAVSAPGSARSADERASMAQKAGLPGRGSVPTVAVAEAMGAWSTTEWGGEPHPTAAESTSEPKRPVNAALARIFPPMQDARILLNGTLGHELTRCTGSTAAAATVLPFKDA